MEFCASNKGKTKQKKKLNKIHSFGRTTGKKSFFFFIRIKKAAFVGDWMNLIKKKQK